MTDEIITIQKEEKINLTELRNEITYLRNEADNIILIDILDNYPDEVKLAIQKENDERELIKADLLYNANELEIKLNNILNK